MNIFYNMKNIPSIPTHSNPPSPPSTTPHSTVHPQILKYIWCFQILQIIINTTKLNNFAWVANPIFVRHHLKLETRECKRKYNFSVTNKLNSDADLNIFDGALLQ